MLVYSNNFSCAVNQNANEYILTFRLAHPVIGEKGEVTGNVNDTVAEIVMNKDGAKALSELISSSFNQSPVVP